LTQTKQVETPNISRKNLSIQTSRYDYLNGAFENNENDCLKTITTGGTIITNTTMGVGAEISNPRQSNDKFSKIESLIKSKNLEKSKLIIVNLTPEQLTNDVKNNINDNNIANDFDKKRNFINEKLSIDHESKRSNGLLRDTINQTDFDLLNDNDLTRKTTNEQNTPLSASKLKNSFNETTTMNNFQQEKHLKTNPSAANYLNNKMELNGASYYNQVSSKDNINDETASQVNNSQAIVYARDPLDNTKTNLEWTQHNQNQSQRFNSLRRYPLDNDDVVAAAENDDKEFDKNKDLTKIKTSTMNNGDRVNIQMNKYRQHDNLLFDHLERLEEEEDLLKKNTNTNVVETNELNSDLTFYNGNKYWTMSSQNKINSNANNNNNDKEDLNSLIQPDKQPIRTGGLKRIKYEDENEVDVKQPNTALTKAKPPKTAKKVKIKLPIDIENIPKLPPRKERSLQKCCLVFFLLILFVIATGILIYFFGEFLCFNFNFKPNLILIQF
jgi:hypothetical protein